MVKKSQTKWGAKIKNIDSYFTYTKKQEDEILNAYKNSKRSKEFKSVKELIRHLRSK